MAMGKEYPHKKDEITKRYVDLMLAIMFWLDFFFYQKKRPAMLANSPLVLLGIVFLAFLMCKKSCTHLLCSWGEGCQRDWKYC